MTFVFYYIPFHGGVSNNPSKGEKSHIANEVSVANGGTAHRVVILKFFVRVSSGSKNCQNFQKYFQNLQESQGWQIFF